MDAPVSSIFARISVWNAWSTVSTRKMIALTLRNVSPVFMVCALELWAMVVPEIPNATAPVKTNLNNERLRVMRRIKLLWGGLPLSDSLKLLVRNWSVIAKAKEAHRSRTRVYAE